MEDSSQHTFLVLHVSMRVGNVQAHTKEHAVCQFHCQTRKKHHVVAMVIN